MSDYQWATDQTLRYLGGALFWVAVLLLYLLVWKALPARTFVTPPPRKHRRRRDGDRDTSFVGGLRKTGVRRGSRDEVEATGPSVGPSDRSSGEAAANQTSNTVTNNTGGEPSDEQPIPPISHRGDKRDDVAEGSQVGSLPPITGHLRGAPMHVPGSVVDATIIGMASDLPNSCHDGTTAADNHHHPSGWKSSTPTETATFQLPGEIERDQEGDGVYSRPPTHLPPIFGEPGNRTKVATATRLPQAQASQPQVVHHGHGAGFPSQSHHIGIGVRKPFVQPFLHHSEHGNLVKTMQRFYGDVRPRRSGMRTPRDHDPCDWDPTSDASSDFSQTSSQSAFSVQTHRRSGGGRFSDHVHYHLPGQAAVVHDGRPGQVCYPMQVDAVQ
ncbi:unnamed protein product [Vitrella brassicaformis CCMP3155]|uniref:Uncharacterized protein n=2 Tax=Vitrella brassicaformis TaxID=1169539 RepID=A0A0G4GWR1_VITBC|nr:unnamed protein product [Vitrella brassicaformis CCMP3155]|eukprot:CEM35278.1 unnamed protein product [Vitrella brassicaformis CCMP3155]